MIHRVVDGVTDRQPDTSMQIIIIATIRLVKRE